MTLEEYAKTRGILMSTAVRLLDRDELKTSLSGHYEMLDSADEETGGSIELDDTAVAVMDEYMVFTPQDEKRVERQRRDAAEFNEQKFRKQKKWMIGSVIAVLVYYIVVFALSMAGVISDTVMLCMILPVLAVILILYLLRRNKGENSQWL